METEIDRNIRAWAMSEVMPWRMRRLADDAVPHAALQLNARSKTAFIYTVRDGSVSVEAKRSELALAHAELRSQMYLGFFQEVLRDYPIPDTTFILDVDDMPQPSPTVPILQFQKPAGSFSILVPDIDFIGWNHYFQPDIVDTIAYDSKSVSAIFVGGTSGQTNTVETVLNPVAQRLLAAKYFRGHPDVHFYLTTLSRCANAEAEQALRDLGFGGPQIQWSEQFAHKFIISVDGNGATCSRVVIALKSYSVLLKYDSPHHLYYFRGLLAWRHYVPIRVDSDIENIIRMERKGPRAFASIAEEGRYFAESLSGNIARPGIAS
jgi:hypothetical protein